MNFSTTTSYYSAFHLPLQFGKKFKKNEWENRRHYKKEKEKLHLWYFSGPYMEGTCPSGGSPPRFLAKVNARIPRLCARFVHLRVGRKRVVYIMTYESWAMVKGPPYNCTEYRTVIACRLLKDVSYLFFPFLLLSSNSNAISQNLLSPSGFVGLHAVTTWFSSQNMAATMSKGYGNLAVFKTRLGIGILVQGPITA